MKINKEFQIIYGDNKYITIKYDRLDVSINHKQFKSFYLA